MQLRDEAGKARNHKLLVGLDVEQKLSKQLNALVEKERIWPHCYGANRTAKTARAYFSPTLYESRPPEYHRE
jgi:hypothetical protein